MTRKWAKAGIGAALILLINAGLANWYLSDVMRGNVAVRTEAQFHKHRHDLRTLILGDSHSKWGVDARLLDRAFNAALPIQSYMHDYYLLRRFVEDGLIQPRFVILPVDLHSFSRHRTVEWAFLHYYARYIDYLEEGWRRGEPVYFAARQFQGRYAPYAAQRDNILHYIETGRPLEAQHLIDLPMKRGSLLGTGRFDKQTKKKRIEVARQIARFQLSARGALDPRRIADFLRLLDLSRELGIRVLLVRYPMTEEYLDAAAQLVDIEEHDRRIAELVLRREGVTLLDARSRFSDRPELFTDPDHLNLRGARRLAGEINAALDDLASKPW